MLACAFYSVCDSRHFPGAVALLNSIRLAGHDEPIFLIDAGLTPQQRSLLAEHATLIPAPEGTPTVFLTPLGPLQHPANVAILLDADIIVVRPLGELIDAVRDGRVIGFVNNEPNHDRFFPEWSSTLGLGRLRRQPYLNAGQLLVPHSLSCRLVQAWNEGLAKVDVRRTWLQGGRLFEPFYFGDQDVLNAIVAARLEADEIITLEHRLAPHPPFAGLRLVDRESMLCRYPDDVQPFVLHHTGAKPWLNATRINVYSLLLSRLLLAPDVAVRLEPDQLPVRLREGWLAGADRSRANAQALLYFHARRELSRFGIRTRIRTGLAAWRRRRALARASPRTG
jgi:hypothetical protein